MPLNVYRYDCDDLSPGQRVVSRGDHIQALTAKNLVAEQAIRAVSPEWDRIRSQSLYVWRDKDFAEAQWRKTKKPYHLYELSIDVADIEHIGDLSYFSMLEDSINTGRTVADYALQAYLKQYQGRPRIEILVKKATVFQKVFDASEK
jgi:hypothetical protein